LNFHGRIGPIGLSIGVDVALFVVAVWFVRSVKPEAFGNANACQKQRQNRRAK